MSTDLSARELQSLRNLGNEAERAADLIEQQAAELARMRAALEVSQAATEAAVSKAQWQARTNAELNALQDEVGRLKKAACRNFNERFDDEPTP